jgi:HemY protein
VSETWAPVAPTTGRLDAFVWDTPPEVLGRSPSGEADFLDHAIQEGAAENLDLPPTPMAAAAGSATSSTPPEARRSEAPPGAIEILSPPAVGASDSPRSVGQSTGPRASTVRPIPDEPIPDAPRPAAPTVVPPASVVTGSANGSAAPTGRKGDAPKEAVVFPFGHPPDDPGPDLQEEKRSRLRAGV